MSTSTFSALHSTTSTGVRFATFGLRRFPDHDVGARAPVAVGGAPLLGHLVEGVAVVVAEVADEVLAHGLFRLPRHVAPFLAQGDPEPVSLSGAGCRAPPETVSRARPRVWVPPRTWARSWVWAPPWASCPCSSLCSSPHSSPFLLSSGASARFPRATSCVSRTCPNITIPSRRSPKHDGNLSIVCHTERPGRVPGIVDQTSQQKPESFPMETGSFIRQSRSALGLSLRSLTQQLGVDAAYLSRIESGRVRPSEQMLGKLATALGRNEDELLLLSGRLPERLRELVARQPHRAATALRTMAEMCVAGAGRSLRRTVARPARPSRDGRRVSVRADQRDCGGRELEEGGVPARVPRAQVVGATAGLGVSGRDHRRRGSQGVVGDGSLLRALALARIRGLRPVHGQRHHGGRGRRSSAARSSAATSIPLRTERSELLSARSTAPKFTPISNASRQTPAVRFNACTGPPTGQESRAGSSTSSG